MVKDNVDAVVVTFNSESYVRACLDSLAKNGARAIVVDNGSSDRTLTILNQEYPKIPVILNSENGYARALNIGLAHTASELVLLSNADVVFPEGSIEPMLSYMREHPDVGVVGPQQLTADWRWQKSYGDIPGPGEGIKDVFGITTFHNGCRRVLWPRRVDRHPQRVPYLGGAVLVVRRTSASSIGGFDEKFTFYAEEVKFCVALREAGWQVVLVPDAAVIHFGGSSSTKIHEKQQAFFGRLVHAKVRLAFELYGHCKTCFYCAMEWIHCVKVAAFYGLSRHLVSMSKSAYFLRRQEIFYLVSEIWKQELRSLREQHACRAQRQRSGSGKE